MEEYLQHMKSLRSQIHDVEDQAAKVSVEEQMLLTTVHTLHADLSLAKYDLLQVKGETEQISKEKDDICARLLDKQKKKASLEFDSCMVRKGLELIQQEKTSSSAKLTEKRDYYTKVAEDACLEFQMLQEEHSLVKPPKVFSESKEPNKVDKRIKILASELTGAMEKLDEVKRRKASIAVETTEISQHLEQMKGRADDLQQLKEMDVAPLEKEHESLLADISAEADCLQTLENQKEKLEGISQVINCNCGKKYMVALKHT
ncbi:hypothetical protein MLD38_001038 [Melastoma candidum]|uniref:Uncharacterized protein n=1 Tax=Melastoma candidum TaxID=119954 RepID=A0ACB9SC06_9MYRT|nr:hypothetical protein MLD38_001038 [Melastoma candidum]